MTLGNTRIRWLLEGVVGSLSMLAVAKNWCRYVGGPKSHIPHGGPPLIGGPLRDARPNSSIGVSRSARPTKALRNRRSSVSAWSESLHRRRGEARALTGRASIDKSRTTAAMRVSRTYVSFLRISRSVTIAVQGIGCGAQGDVSFATGEDAS